MTTKENEEYEIHYNTLKKCNENRVKREITGLNNFYKMKKATHREQQPQEPEYAPGEEISGQAEYFAMLRRSTEESKFNYTDE